MSRLEKKFDRDSAQEFLAYGGKSLQMEYFHWSRLGENARIWAFMPDAWISGTAKYPSLHTFNALVFILGLLSCFWGFLQIGYGLAGFLACMIISFSPLYLYEIHLNQNILGMVGSATLLLLGLHLRFLSAKPMQFGAHLIPLVSGLFIGFFTEIRGESKILLASCILVYILCPNLRWKQKSASILIVLVVFLGSQKSIRNYFNIKFEQAKQIVTNLGGNPYMGARIEEHLFWHCFFIGAGDFDQKYGIVWNDSFAYQMALPIMKQKYQFRGKYLPPLVHLNEFYDAQKKYYIKFDELPEYQAVIKELALEAIFSDPIWYSQIIFRRIKQILSVTTPFHYLGWFIFPFLFWAVRKKEKALLIAVFFSLPPSASSLLIYSKGNMTYQSLFPEIITGILMSQLLKWVWGKMDFKFRKWV
jgi:hypothetical protein